MKNQRKWYRMWKILSLAFTVLAEVYWYRIVRKKDKDWEELWVKIGKRFRRTLFELEGLLIKVGQIMSIRADLLPAGFIKQIEDLVDQVPSSPWEEMRAVLAREWGCAIEEKVRFIQPEAVASASIGEVFQGELLDGTKVAIKVMRPTIKSIVKSDFRSLYVVMLAARYLAPVPKGFIDFRMLYKELKQVIERELDFLKEKETAKHFSERFKTVKKLKIPQIYESLSTSEVLVMEWADGVRITDEDFMEENGINRIELAEQLFSLFLPQWLEPGIFHADPHAGNVLLQKDGTIVLLDFGMIGEISKKDAKHFQELLAAILMKNYSKAADVLLNLGFLLPEADPAVIQRVLEEALSFDLSQLKQLDLIALNKEINDRVKSLPVQVPTRFVFLGRSFVTIEGIVRTISPDQETIEIIKPAFISWLKTSDANKWRLLVNWVYSQPVLKALPMFINDFINSGKTEKQNQRKEFEFIIIENHKKSSIYFGLLGTAGIFISILFHHNILLYASAGGALLSAFAYFSISVKERRWMKRNFSEKK
ncbi:AarF/UbiB family protein [Metabacillus idriensis]|uniref:AarF/ABC1/UbiB kinase family protein n=1 Tax=Metabacillus idriensis TaxID=324768 RepID=A0A6I2MAW9_9BACI|nr:AarF/UbiB family protein [Metabacillus idriensis]MCM3598604.1 AarF/UbiB family protein [Metabacillus idriensis]MRX54442.1 AarF/ABC1/UbiB kinase family protein [Metabacillus idriensis]